MPELHLQSSQSAKTSASREQHTSGGRSRRGDTYARPDATTPALPIWIPTCGPKCSSCLNLRTGTRPLRSVRVPIFPEATPAPLGFGFLLEVDDPPTRRALGDDEGETLAGEGDREPTIRELRLCQVLGRALEVIEIELCAGAEHAP
jgi:hypothetical protein